MVLEKLEQKFTVCKVEEYPPEIWKDTYCFIGKTDEECSLVCQTEHTPEHTLEREDGWRAFRIQGSLDFSLVGILARITEILAQEKIGIFAVSTYQTDYLLTREKDYERAILALERNGYQIEAECREIKKKNQEETG